MTINGAKMPRWIAERSGLLPVTFFRTIKALTHKSAQTEPPTFIPACREELRRLFPADKFSPATKSTGREIWGASDGFGNPCVAFWPQTF